MKTDGWKAALFGMAAIFAAVTAGAAEVTDVAAVPQLDAAGQARYSAFLEAPRHRAFAIAPGGTWGLAIDRPTAAAAAAAALQSCRKETTQFCRLYAVDDRVVFDAEGWAASWQASPAKEQNIRVGIELGDSFPDLALSAPDGKPITLADLRGRVVLLHFWGSWCQFCQKELPELQQLYSSLAPLHNVAFVLIQARESIEVSRRWAARRGFTLPLYDSGTLQRSDSTFRLADGTSIKDRSIADQFPTTYVLDPDGKVVFGHPGFVARWLDYVPLIRHLAGSPAQTASAY